MRKWRFREAKSFIHSEVRTLRSGRNRVPSLVGLTSKPQSRPLHVRLFQSCFTKSKKVPGCCTSSNSQKVWGWRLKVTARLLRHFRMDMEFCLTREKDVWEKHFHFRDGDDVMVMMVVVVAADTYQTLPQSPMFAAARGPSPWYQLHEKVLLITISVTWMRQLRLREIRYLVQGHPAWKAQGWRLKAPEARPLLTTQQLPFGAAEPASRLQRRSLTLSVSTMPYALIFSNQPLRTAVYYTGDSCDLSPLCTFGSRFPHLDRWWVPYRYNITT